MINNSLGILEAVQQKHGACSWYRVAKLLNVAPSRVIQIKNGAEVMSKNIAVKAAEILNIEPADLVLIVESERTTDPVLRDSYKRLMVRAGVAAAAISHSLICILCKIGELRETRDPLSRNPYRPRSPSHFPQPPITFCHTPTQSMVT